MNLLVLGTDGLMRILRLEVEGGEMGFYSASFGGWMTWSASDSLVDIEHLSMISIGWALNTATPTGLSCSMIMVLRRRRRDLMLCSCTCIRTIFI